MTLRLEDKKAIVAELTDVAQSSVSAAIAEYRGLTVSQMTELRAKARASNVYLKVVRNTLARRAVQETEFACLNEALTGPVLVMFAREEPSAAARIIRDFEKNNDALKVSALALGGELMGADKLKQVASLPSKDEAIAQLMSVMRAPVEKLVRTLAEPAAMVARTFAQVRDQKQGE